MRIGIVTSWNTRCGIAEYSAFLSDALHRREGNVLVFANQQSEFVREDSPNVIRAWSNDRSSLPRLIAAIGMQGLDGLIIEHHLGFYSLEVLAELTARVSHLGVPVVVCPHQVQADEADYVGCAADLSKAVAIQVHRESDRQYLEARGLSNVVVVPHGVYVPEGTDLHLPALLPERSERIEHTDVVIASFGFLMAHKGYAELIAACALLRQRIPRLRLKIYSSAHPSTPSSALADYLRMFARQLGAASWCTIDTEFHETEEVVSRLHRATMLVFAYQHTNESSSAAVRMALAAGRPTVCTPLAIFDDVQDAVVKTAGTDSFCIADRVWSLLHDEPALHDLAVRQRQYLKKYAWATVAVRVLDLLGGRKGAVPISSPPANRAAVKHSSGPTMVCLGIALETGGDPARLSIV